MLRFFSIVFFVLAAIRLVLDWRATISQGERFEMALVGDVWFVIHQSSLQLIQPAIERYVSVALWEWVFRPFLVAPLAPILIGLGLIFWLLARRKRKTR